MKKKTPPGANPVQARSFGPRRKGERTRVEIVEAAIRVIATGGFHRLGYESIATELGLSRAHISYHYPKLETLWLEALRRSVEVGQDLTIQRVTSAISAEERVFAFAEGAFLAAERYPAHTRTYALFFHLGSVTPSINRLFTEIRELGARRLAALIGAAWPQLEPPAAYELARSIQSLLTGALASWVGTSQYESLGTVQAETLRTLRRWLAPFNQTTHS